MSEPEADGDVTLYPPLEGREAFDLSGRRVMAGAPVFKWINAPWVCVTCFDEVDVHDEHTGLCRPCFRAWRFGSRK